MPDKDSDIKDVDLPKEIFDELEKISKLDDSLSEFNNLVEENKLANNKNDKNIIKKDKNAKKDEIKTILSAQEKKRYENLGKAFMVGADSVIKDIQNAIAKKERNSLTGKDNVESKIKEAEKKLASSKKKKSSVITKILAATAILGGLYIIFSGTINNAIQSLYDKVKNGMLGFGTFIKKSASSIFSFFGNMFIKASESLRGGGLLSMAMIGIIWDFFNVTLPTLLMSLVEDLIRIINKDYKSSLKLDNQNRSLDKTMNNSQTTASKLADMAASQINNFILTQEKDVRENGILNAKQQEEIADKSFSYIRMGMQSIIDSSKKIGGEYGKRIGEWGMSLTRMIGNNQISSTAFYQSSTKILDSMSKLIPNLYTISEANASESAKNTIVNFMKDYGASIGMSTEDIEAYSKLTIDQQIDILRNLRNTMSSFHKDVTHQIEQAEKEKGIPDDSQNDSIVSLLRNIRKDMQNKDSHLHIIKFQETTQLGELQVKIQKFIDDTKFSDVMSNFSSTVSKKLSLILDAANVSLGSLTKAVINEFGIAGLGEKDVVVDNSEFNPVNETTLGADKDFKILYIFNNSASANEADIDAKMIEFINHSAEYSTTLTEEISVLSQLERLSLALYSGVLHHSKMVNNAYENMGEVLSTHAKTPVRKRGTSAHPFDDENGGGSTSFAGSPYSPNCGGLGFC